MILVSADELETRIEKAVKKAVDELIQIQSMRTSSEKEDELLTEEEARKFLKIKSRTTLWKRVKAGQIHPIRDRGGQLLRFPKSDLIKYQNSLERACNA